MKSTSISSNSSSKPSTSTTASTSSSSTAPAPAPRAPSITLNKNSKINNATSFGFAFSSQSDTKAAPSLKELLENDAKKHHEYVSLPSSSSITAAATTQSTSKGEHNSVSYESPMEPSKHHSASNNTAKNIHLNINTTSSISSQASAPHISNGNGIAMTPIRASIGNNINSVNSISSIALTPTTSVTSTHGPSSPTATTAANEIPLSKTEIALRKKQKEYVRSIRRSFPSSAAEAKYRYGDLPSLLRAAQLDRPIALNKANGQISKQDAINTAASAAAVDNAMAGGELEEKIGLFGRVRDLDRAFKKAAVAISPEELKRLQLAAEKSASQNDQAHAEQTGNNNANNDPKSSAASQSDQTKKKQPVYISWDTIKDERIVKSNQPSVWWAPEYSKDKGLNPSKEIERLFPVIDTSEKKQAAVVAAVAQSGKEVIRSVLETRRATTISIVMRRLGIKTTKFAKLAWHFRDMDEKFLTREAVEMIQSNALWPTAEELRLLKNRFESGLELAEPDQLLWFMATTVPDVAARTCAMAFRYEFEESVEEMISACATIEIAAKELMTSKLLKRLMHIIVMIGNRINDIAAQNVDINYSKRVASSAQNPRLSSRAASSLGFDAYDGVKAINLEALLKLSHIRSPVNRSITVLECVVKYVEAEAPELLEVSSYLMCTPSASKYDLMEQEKFLTEARRGLEKVRLIPKMESFHFQANKKLNTIEKNLNKASEIFRDALEYFGYDRFAMDSSTFFNHMKEFLAAYDQIVEKITSNDGEEGEENREEGDTFHFTPISSKPSNLSYMSNTRKSIFAGLGFGGGSASKANNRKSIFGRLR